MRGHNYMQIEAQMGRIETKLKQMLVRSRTVTKIETKTGTKTVTNSVRGVRMTEEALAAHKARESTSEAIKEFAEQEVSKVSASSKLVRLSSLVP